MVVARGRCPQNLFRGRCTPLRTITIFKSKTITIELDCIFYTCKVYKKPNVLNLQFKFPPPPNLFCSLCRGKFFPHISFPFSTHTLPSFPCSTLQIPIYPILKFSTHRTHPSHIPPLFSTQTVPFP